MIKLKKYNTPQIREKVKIRIDDELTKKIWNSALKAKKEVDNWPAWKRGKD